MTKAERAIVKRAIRELMAEEQQFTSAVGRLCRLVGWRYPAAEIDETKTITINELMRRLDAEKEALK